MFDKEAIEALQQGEAIKAAIEATDKGLNESGIFALPDNFKVHDQEDAQPFRRRQRGVMETKDIIAFADYVSSNKSDGATVFVDSDNLHAAAVLNFGTNDRPGHADNRAIISLRSTAAYKALLANASGSWRTQKEVAEFMEDWMEQMQFFNDNHGELSPGRAIAAIRKITIESMRKMESSEQTLSAAKSAFESVQATSADPIPTVLYFKTEPFQYIEERTFVLRLGVSTQGDKPLLNLRIQKLEEHQQEMAQEFAGLMGKHFTDVPIIIGSYKRGQ